MSFTSTPQATTSSGGPPPPTSAATGLGGIASSLATNFASAPSKRPSPSTILGALADGGQKTLLGQ